MIFSPCTLLEKGTLIRFSEIILTLAKMAKEVLAGPASSAPSERQFSVGDSDEEKEWISAQTLETIVLLPNKQILQIK